jgi:DNA-binding NtrC family response regulator
MAASRQFRMDLYYRLSVFEINIPPLRAHKQDIPKLIDHFQKIDHLELEFTSEARNMMFHYNWPGNVRELRNVLTRLHFLYPNTVIDQQHIYSATGEMFHLVQLEDYHSGEEMPPPTQAQTHYDREGNCLGTEASIVPPAPASNIAPAQEPILTLSQLEEKHIRSTLAAVGQNYSEAARLLGISRSTLYGKVKKYGIA